MVAATNKADSNSKFVASTNSSKSLGSVNSTKSSGKVGGSGNSTKVGGTGSKGVAVVPPSRKPAPPRTPSNQPDCFTSKKVTLPGANGPEWAWYNAGGCTCKDARDRIIQQRRK